VSSSLLIDYPPLNGCRYYEYASNAMSNIDKLEIGLLQLRDDVNEKATPNKVMITAHLNIHPVIMELYGLTLEQEEGGVE